MFTLPHFPLTMNIYKMTFPYNFLTKTFRVSVPCQLRAWGSHPRTQYVSAFPTGSIVGEVAVLCGPHTDIRDNACSGASDLVELPAGSGRWYFVVYVDDVAKGDPNEYRQAYIAKAYTSADPNYLNFPYWPSPIP